MIITIIQGRNLDVSGAAMRVLNCGGTCRWADTRTFSSSLIYLSLFSQSISRGNIIAFHYCFLIFLILTESHYYQFHSARELSGTMGSAMPRCPSTVARRMLMFDRLAPPSSLAKIRFENSRVTAPLGALHFCRNRIARENSLVDIWSANRAKTLVKHTVLDG